MCIEPDEHFFFCVIPSVAEGPRIFLDAWPTHPNEGATATCAEMRW